jgi:hypothetical protein
VTRRLPPLAALLCALAVLGLGPGTALAKSKPTSNPVIVDCLQHPGGLIGHYTTTQLNHALQVMPAETKEYTDCPDVINRARLASLGKLPGGGGTGGSGSFLPTPVLIILIVAVLVAVTLGAIAVRRRSSAAGAGRSGVPQGPGDANGPTQGQRPDGLSGPDPPPAG